jgi:hypothetical protein
VTSRWRRCGALALAAAVIALPAGALVAPPAQAGPIKAACPDAAKSVCGVVEGVLKNGTVPGIASQVVPAAAGTGFEAIMDTGFGAMAAGFGEAGVGFLASLSRVFVESSTVDLDATGVRTVLALTVPVAMLVAVLLVVTAAGKTAWTGNGSVAATALVGLGKTVLVTAMVLAVTQAALKASDALASWIIRQGLGGNPQLEHRLGTLISLDAVDGSPALVLVFGFLAILVGLVLWVELLFRQVAIVVLVAVAPIAATGQILPETTEWWTRTRNALIQLVVLKPVIAFCFAVGFATLGSSGDLRGVVAGFVTLLVAALAWPLLARFMPFTSAGSGHSALAGLVSTGAGLLAGHKISTSGGTVGAAGYPGPGYASVLEAQNDAALAARSARVGGLTALTGPGNTGGSAGAAGAAGVGGMAGGVGAAVGAAATLAAGAVDHVESQLSSAAADAGLGYATRPSGGYGHTRGRLGGPHHHGHRHGGSRPPGATPAGHDTDAPDATHVDSGTDHVDIDSDAGGPPAIDPAGVEVEPDGTRP